MYGILLAALSVVYADAIDTDGPIVAVETESANALEAAASQIEEVFAANPDDAQLSDLVRSYFNDVAAQFATAVGYEAVYSQAQAAAAAITDNAAAREVLTAQAPTYTSSA